MKKLFAIVAAMIVSITVASAQFGIVCGLTSSNTEVDFKDLKKNVDGICQYHVGFAYNIPLIIGFAVQPELIYQVKGVKISSNEGDEKLEGKTGFAELGVGVQLGIDFNVVRPFIFAKPYAGVAIDNCKKNGTDSAFENAKKNLECGMSFGAGTDLFNHFQISLEFYKNLGYLFNEGKFNDNVSDAFKDFSNLKSYNGVKLTIGIFF